MASLNNDRQLYLRREKVLALEGIHGSVDIIGTLSVVFEPLWLVAS